MDISLNNEISQALDTSHLQIHIKIKQRNGKKSWTIVEGLDKIQLPENKTTLEFLEDVTRRLKKSFSCGANVNKEDNTIHLNGDHRNNVKDFLIKNKLVDETQIRMHGF